MRNPQTQKNDKERKTSTRYPDHQPMPTTSPWLNSHDQGPRQLRTSILLTRTVARLRVQTGSSLTSEAAQPPRTVQARVGPLRSPQGNPTPRWGGPSVTALCRAIGQNVGNTTQIVCAMKLTGRPSVLLNAARDCRNISST